MFVIIINDFASKNYVIGTTLDNGEQVIYVFTSQEKALLYVINHAAYFARIHATAGILPATTLGVDTLQIRVAEDALSKN